MPSVNISDFQYGMDRRRPRVAGVPGTLWDLKNAHITRGGDIERSKKFVPVYTLPANTYGLGQINGQLYVFGSSDLSASMPAGVQFQRLQFASQAMVRVLQSIVFNGKHYVVVEFADGSVQHYYDGSRVSAWDTLAASNSSVVTLAAYLARKVDSDDAVTAISYGNTIEVTAAVAGTAFTLTGSTSNGGSVNDQTLTVTTPVANVAEVAEVRATGTVTITGGTRDPGVNYIGQITVNGTNLLATRVDWITSNAATAAAVAAKINNSTATSGYSATASGAAVTIRAAVGTGATPNGYVVARSVAGDVTTTVANMSGGVTYVAPVAQVSRAVFGGTYEAGDLFALTLNGTLYVAKGTASGHAGHSLVYKRRLYHTAGSLYRWCKLDDPTDLTTSGDSGAGFINMANESEGSDRLMASAPYQQDIAVFSNQAIRIYDIQVVASSSEFKQALENTGTKAPRSVLPYGNVDVFYLGENGVRSLQSRDINNAAFISDVGSAIDTFISGYVAEIGEAKAERAVGAFEPLDGRFMLALGERVFVLSHFPASKISAWSYYEPGFEITDMIRVGRRLYVRDEDTIYLYGGADGETYPDDDEQEVSVEMPFVSAGEPSNFKQWEGFDMACSGQWTIDLFTDPNDTSDNKAIDVGVVTETTYDYPHIGVVGNHPMFALRATCNKAGPATISSCSFHFSKNETE